MSNVPYSCVVDSLMYVMCLPKGTYNWSFDDNKPRLMVTNG